MGLGVLVGVAVGAVVGVAVGAVVGVAVGAVVGVAVASGAVVGVASGAVVGVASGAVVGVASGTSVGVASGAVVGVASGTSVGVTSGTSVGVVSGAVVDVASPAAGVGVDVGSSPLRGFAGSSQAASRHASRTQVRSTESIRASFFAKKREIESFMMVSSFLYGWYAFGVGIHALFYFRICQRYVALRDSYGGGWYGVSYGLKSGSSVRPRPFTRS